MVFKILEVIESFHWLNVKTGATASIYGAVPWTSKDGESQWSKVSRGFTWRLYNGTVGLGRIPAKSREEAENIMSHFNNRMEG